jgi:hypothetical protein
VRFWVAGLFAIVAVAGFAFAAGPDRPGGPAPRDAGAGDGGAAGPSAPGRLPDPPPLTTRHQWVIDLAYGKGEVSVRDSRRIALPRPTPTPRMMGRFAVELYVGRELIDRVRFNFPLLGAGDWGDDDARWDAPPSFERGLSASAAVVIPHSERTTRALIVDRATGREWPLAWPPVGRDGGAPASITPH